MKLTFLRFFIIIGILIFYSANSFSTDKEITSAFLAPGYANLDYKLPDVGSYSLPVFKNAENGTVLTIDGKQSNLHTEFDNKYVVMGFVYSNCNDINGCPLTAYVFYKLKMAMEKDPVLAERFKLISLSFDPQNDTPDKIKLYANNFKYTGNEGEWQFLTTSSQETLEPILKSYNQTIQKQIVDGKVTNSINHILRVFLIDPKKRIRNIYSVSFLHADSVLTDLRTIMMEDETNNKEVNVATKNNTLSPRDYSIVNQDKQGYENSSYASKTKAITSSGKPADLLAILESSQLGLPAVKIPEFNPISKEKIELGRKLFFDRRLSFNNTFSCAMCHIPQQGFSNNEMATAVGVEGRSNRRNSPSLYNVAYNTLLFHDGREELLEQQIWGPLLSHNKMGNISIGALLNKIRNIPDYIQLFETAFNGEGPNMETLGMALASYQRTLISGNSAFDRWYYGKQENAISAQAQRGYNLFTGKAGCSSCHLIEQKYALFTDNKLHNTGLGYAKSMGIKPEKQRILVAPGIFMDVDSNIIDEVSENLPADVGLYEITQNPHDRWKYKTPTLRNVSLTAPYFHDGSIVSLNEVVQFYNRGGVSNELLDPRIRSLNLNEGEVDELVAFLQTLTGNNVNTLVSDASSAPIGDITKEDPSWIHESNNGLLQ